MRLLTCGPSPVAGRAILPSILTAMQRIVNASDPLKFHYTAISYKPLLSLFNMTGIVADDQLPPALGQLLSLSLPATARADTWHI